MSDPGEVEPVGDDEFIYRKIPVSTGWYDPDISDPLSPKAFNPRPDDTTGLSVDRAKYTTVEQAARGPSNKGYYVAVLRVGDLRAGGLDVVARPVQGNPGHAELPDLTYENRKTDQALKWKDLLAYKFTIRVEGPFH